MFIVGALIITTNFIVLIFTEAAALPLTVLTAWEGMAEGMGIPFVDKPAAEPKTILIVGGAGGVGTIGTLILTIA